MGQVPAVSSWLVDALDRWWLAEHRPDPYTVVVVSGDDGSLARSVLESGPDCMAALRYVLVDPSGPPAAPPGMTAALSLEEPAYLLPSAPGGMDPDEPFTPAAGVGPLVTYLSGIPVVSDPVTGGSSRAPGALVAIDVLGRMPAERVEWRDGCWWELRLVATEDADGLLEVAVPLAPGADSLLPPSPAVGRYSLHTGARAWLRDTLGGAPRGVLAVVDHWTVTTEPIGAESGAVAFPLALDQLAAVDEPTSRSPEPVAAGLEVVTWRVG